MVHVSDGEKNSEKGEHCQDMSGTARTEADIRSGTINDHKLSADSTRAVTARKLAQLQTRPRPSANLDLPSWLINSQGQPLSSEMQITDDEAAELKTWIVKKLENMYVELTGYASYLSLLAFN